MNVSLSDKAAELDKFVKESTGCTEYKKLAQQVQAILPDMSESERIAMYREAVNRRTMNKLQELADYAKKEYDRAQKKPQINTNTVISVVNAILENKEAFSPVLDWMADEISSRLKARPI